MVDVLATLPPLTDSEAKLLRDAEAALKRPRELLAHIEVLLAFRHFRRTAPAAEAGPPDCPNTRAVSYCGRP